MQLVRYVLIGALLLGLANGTLSSARAQEADTLPPDSLRWSVGGYVGAFLLDDDELDGVFMTSDAGVIFGARVGYRLNNPHWEIEGGFGYSPLTAESEAQEGEIDGNLFTYHAGVGYLVPTGERARLRLSAGAGAMYYSYDPFDRFNEARDEVELIDTSWANEFVLLFGAGFEFDAGERFLIRFDARDHVQFCNEEDTPINETEDFSHCPLDSTVLSNPEFTGGVGIRF